MDGCQFPTDGSVQEIKKHLSCFYSLHFSSPSLTFLKIGLLVALINFSRNLWVHKNLWVRANLDEKNLKMFFVCFSTILYRHLDFGPWISTPELSKYICKKQQQQQQQQLWW